MAGAEPTLKLGLSLLCPTLILSLCPLVLDPVKVLETVKASVVLPAMPFPSHRDKMEAVTSALPTTVIPDKHRAI